MPETELIGEAITAMMRKLSAFKMYSGFRPGRLLLTRNRGETQKGDDLDRKHD